MNYYVQNDRNNVICESSAKAVDYCVCEKNNYYVHEYSDNFHEHNNSRSSKNGLLKNFKELICLYKTYIIIPFLDPHVIYVPVETHLNHMCRKSFKIPSNRSISTGTSGGI